MSDPMARAPADNRQPDLFSILPPPAVFDTQTEGHLAADKFKAERYRQITDLLATRGPLANWEIADALKCQPHQTSGRLTELRTEGVIENTGERRKNPRTNVSGEVVRLKIAENDFIVVQQGPHE